jgi:hypothetical protein
LLSRNDRNGASRFSVQAVTRSEQFASRLFATERQMQNQSGGGQTGTRDTTYNLTAILYHALQGVENCKTYEQDAQGEEQLAQFFRQAGDQQRQLAEQAKQLLHDCLMQETQGGQGGQQSSGSGSAFGFGQGSDQSSRQSEMAGGQSGGMGGGPATGGSSGY